MNDNKNRYCFIFGIGMVVKLKNPSEGNKNKVYVIVEYGYRPGVNGVMIFNFGNDEDEMTETAWWILNSELEFIAPTINEYIFRTKYKNLFI